MLMSDSQSQAGEYDHDTFKIATITRQAGGRDLLAAAHRPIMLRQAPLMSNRKLQTLANNVNTSALLDLIRSNQDQSFLVCKAGRWQGFQSIYRST